MASFYLGSRVDPEAGAAGSDAAEPVLPDARRLTTHAVCVGMTGSGKTGLLLAREEIGRLSPPVEAAVAGATVAVVPSPSGAASAAGKAESGGPRPILPPGVREVFLSPPHAAAASDWYRPAICGRGRVHFVKPKEGIDLAREVAVLAEASANVGAIWAEGVML